MIGRLRGVLGSVEADRIILDVGGVGYEVRVPETVRAKLPASGVPVELCIRTLFSEEEGFLLYGFPDAWQRRLFDLLRTVSGVGPRLALNLMSATEPDRLVRALALKDTRALQALPGIGSKLAQRLVLELSEKVAELAFEKRIERLAAATAKAEQWVEELIDSLVGLGYRRQEARRAVETALQNNPDADEQTLLREAIRLAAEGKR